MRRSAERIPGGLASGMSPSDFDPVQLDKGIMVELEHVVKPGRRAPSRKDLEIAMEIAMDHLTEHPRYYDVLEQAEQRMEHNPRKVPILQRQDALDLATEVATKGWTRYGPKTGRVGYWEKTLPGGMLHIIESPSILRKYELQYVDQDGTVVGLGSAGRSSSLEEAQVRAVLKAQRGGYPVVNPQRVRNLAPRGAAIIHSGKLHKLAEQMDFNAKPFLQRLPSEQHRILDACVEEYGYRSCLGSTMLLGNLPEVHRQPRTLSRVRFLTEYLVSKYGGSEAAGPRRNPPDGSWSAVPAILMHVDVGSTKLTMTQVTQLTMETT